MAACGNPGSTAMYQSLHRAQIKRFCTILINFTIFFKRFPNVRSFNDFIENGPEKLYRTVRGNVEGPNHGERFLLHAAENISISMTISIVLLKFLRVILMNWLKSARIYKMDFIICSNITIEHGSTTQLESTFFSSYQCNGPKTNNHAESYHGRLKFAMLKFQTPFKMKKLIWQHFWRRIKNQVIILHEFCIF